VIVQAASDSEGRRWVVAVKRLRSGPWAQGVQIAGIRELCALQAARDCRLPTVPQLQRCFVVKGRLHLVLDRADVDAEALLLSLTEFWGNRQALLHLVKELRASGDLDAEAARTVQRAETALGDLAPPPLPLDIVLHVVRSCLLALAAMHAAGHMHQDIKLGNVLLACDAVPSVQPRGGDLAGAGTGHAASPRHATAHHPPSVAAEGVSESISGRKRARPNEHASAHGAADAATLGTPPCSTTTPSAPAAPETLRVLLCDWGMSVPDPEGPASQINSAVESSIAAQVLLRRRSHVPGRQGANRGLDEAAMPVAGFIDGHGDRAAAAIMPEAVRSDPQALAAAGTGAGVACCAASDAEQENAEGEEEDDEERYRDVPRWEGGVFHQVTTV